MKKLLTNNWGLKLLAVVVACIIWLFVLNADDPEVTQVYSDVEVEIRNSDSFGVDKTFSVQDDSDAVRVWVTARKSVLDKLRSSDFKVVADMRDVTLSDSVPYTLECTNSSINKANWECEPASMKIEIEDVVQESFGVEVITTGSTAQEYEVGSTTIEEGDTINIAGAASLIGIINKVSVSINVSSMAKSETKKGSITITDGNGTTFTKSQMEKLVFTTASGELLQDNMLNVAVNLWEVQSDIQIEVGTYGTPAFGYHVTDVKVTPETVSLAGDEETLSELGGVLNMPDMIDVDGASESFTSETINLYDFLTENYNGRLKLEDRTASVLSVRVLIEKTGTRQIDIPMSAVTIRGKPSDMDIVLTPADKITLEVAAQEGVALDELSGDEIKAVLDLSDYREAGLYNVTVDIRLPDGYVLGSEVSIAVNLTEKEKEENETEAEK